MISKQNSIMHLLVAKAVARTATPTATDPSVATYPATGEIVVTDESGTVLTSTTVVGKPKIRIVQSQGATLPSIQSPMIERAGVKSYQGKAYAAAAQQVDYIGYNVTTNAGDIEVISDNGYMVTIEDKSSMAYGTVGMYKHGFYKSDSSATKEEVWSGLAVSLYQNFAHVTRPPFIVERVASVIAGTDTTAAAGTLTFVNGSSVVTASVSSTGNGIAVGAYVKTDDAAVDTGVLYEVTEILSATTFAIDIPYQAAGAAFTAGNASVYTAALLSAGSLGIKLTGIAEVFVSPQETTPYVNQWNTVVKNGGTTTVVTQTKASQGNGESPEMAYLESFLLGNEGFIARNNVPYQSPRANIVSGEGYSVISLEWDSTQSGQIFNQESASKQLLLAFAGKAAGNREQLTGVVTSVQTVLNAWIGTTPGPFVDLALA